MADEGFIVYSPEEYKIKIIKWRVREYVPVNNSQVILLYEIYDSNDKEVKRLKAPRQGVVKKRLCKDGAIIEKKSPILILSDCVHTTVIKDMCADCGADLRQDENGTQSEASVPMVHSVPDLKVTQQLAKKLGNEDTKRLLSDKKLVLLVDLDQTIIHTTNDNVPNNIKDIYHFQLYGPNSPWYHTRLRPGTLDFLNKVSSYYELHICTFGARNYAHTIAQLIDPDGKYFSHRILSRDECLSITSKTDNLKALFPCGDSMVCIIDDREDVWNMASNLIQVKPYHFFQHTGDINAPPGLSKTELDGKGVQFNENPKSDSSPIVNDQKEDSLNINEKQNTSTEENKCGEKIKENLPTITNSEETTSNQIDSENLKKTKENSKSRNDCRDNEQNSKMITIDDPDDYLLHLETILINIHEQFYKKYDQTKQIPDLKILIPKFRSEILRKQTLVFSGLIPNHMKLEQSRAYMIARSLGATVSPNLIETTTHLVAVTAGTYKFNAARKQNDIHIVTPDWLWCCAERWEHVDEKLFPVDPSKPSKMRQPPPHCHSPEHIVNYNEKFETTQQEEQPKFLDTINPLLSFSNADLDEMHQEFDQFFESDTSTDDEPVNIENPPVKKCLKKRKKQENVDERQRQFFSRSNDSKFVIGQENPKKEVKSDDEDEDETITAKFRRGEDLPSDLEIEPNESEGSNEPIDEEDDGDWNMMGAALEREFLGLE